MVETCVDPAALDVVRRAVQALVRAERTLRTYPAGNQLSQAAIRKAGESLAPALPLELELQPGNLIWQGTETLEETDRSDLPTRLYRDGVRRLTLAEGLDLEELRRLLLAIATPIHPDDLSEDYVTRIWESELGHVQVVAVDPYLDHDLPDEVLEGKHTPTEDLSDVLGPDHRGPDVPPPPEQAFHISDEDRARVNAEVERLSRATPWARFVAALFDVIEGTHGPVEKERVRLVVEMLEATFARLVDEGSVRIAERLLRRFDSDIPEAGASAAAAARARMLEPERLAGVHHALESGDQEPAEIASLWLWLGPNSVPALCKFLVEAGARATEQFYVETLVRIGSAAVAPICDGVRRHEPAIAVRFARALAHFPGEESAATLVWALRSSDARLRREAIRGLARVGGDAARVHLAKAALNDADASARIVALQLLGEHRAALAVPELLARLRSGSDRSDEELDLLYRALGETHGPEAVPFLRKALSGWLPGHATTWRRATRALAEIGTAEAVSALEKGASSRRTELAQACRDALDRRQAHGRGRG